MTDKAAEEKIDYPYIVFCIGSRLFTLNSAHVMAIREMPAVEALAEAPDDVRGVFLYMDRAVPMLDLRTVIGVKTLNSEYLEFVNMLEQRKQDHRRWVEELNRTIEAHEPFRLATDPHKCAFGQWYYGFKSDNNAINHHMKKIEEPHRLLHETAVEATACTQEHDRCKRAICVKTVLHDAEFVYAKMVMDLIEEAKEVMKDSFREMALVMEYNGNYYGLAVDEVLSVGEVEDSGGRENIASIAASPLVKAIRKSPRYPKDLIIELDEEKLPAYCGL